MSLELKELTGKIIECAIKVHKELGCGFLESIYQTALPIELLKHGLEIETQKEIKIDFFNISVFPCLLQAGVVKFG